MSKSGNHNLGEIEKRDLLIQELLAVLMQSLIYLIECVESQPNITLIKELVGSINNAITKATGGAA